MSAPVTVNLPGVPFPMKRLIGKNNAWGSINKNLKKKKDGGGTTNLKVTGSRAGRVGGDGHLRQEGQGKKNEQL